MPFVLVSCRESTEELLTEDALNMIAVAITDILPGDLDPLDDIDLDLKVRHRKARSKYDLTVSIEAKHTDERDKLLEKDLTDAIQRRIDSGFNGRLTVNVWLKLVHAGYAPS